ncbi:MAG: Hsp70 family protein [Deltaproteobacteria bacterium]|nr:Hsp70 family protein [Deltaproteobacteria bacterium]
MSSEEGKAGGVVRVGVDFGTTHTLVALADAGNYPILRLPFEYEGEILHREHVPSCITWFNEKLYYGPAAMKCFLEHFEEGAVMVPSIKRFLQDWSENREISLGPANFFVADLLTGFLSAIHKAILQALEVDEVLIESVIAVPANASSSQRYVTLNSFHQAGFKVLRILDEPCAAGIQFVRERYKRWDRVEADVLIYDLGGGTFDTTLLSIRRGHYDPLLSRGISRLGGDDFDEILLKLVEDRLEYKFEGRERVEMLQAARTVKESIGSYTQKLHVDTSQGVVSVPIKEFQDEAHPLMERTIDLVDELLSETKGLPESPDRIVLVGGGSLLALVPKALRDRFGRSKIHVSLYPFASVAIGAAIQAVSPDLTVQDRLNNNFGVIRVGQGGVDYVDVIFEKGRRLPPADQVYQVSRPAYDPRHNIGRFRYLECDEVDPATRQIKGDCVYWNEIFFPYDRNLHINGQAPKLDPSIIVETEALRQERIKEEYFLDEFGIVTARISRMVLDNYSASFNLYRRK